MQMLKDVPVGKYATTSSTLQVKHVLHYYITHIVLIVMKNDDVVNQNFSVFWRAFFIKI